MFMCDVTKTPPYARYSFVQGDVSMGNGKDDNVVLEFITVGQQTPCKLSFAHKTVTSQRILIVRTKRKFGKCVVSFA